MKRSWLTKTTLSVAVAIFGVSLPLSAQNLRVLGADFSCWQTDITVADWATFKRPTDQQVNGVDGDGLDFVVLRASRGGTSGIDKRACGFPFNDNDAFNGSQRYDDPYFVQNITRATAAGVLAGSYHFSRPDIIASTLDSSGNATGVANTGTDEANHFIQLAGAWMRPGYLLPVHDFEAGAGARSNDEMAQFCIDFSDRIYEVMGIRPAIYAGGNYVTILQNSSASLRTQVVAKYPALWTPRWPNQDDPDSIPVQTAHPGDYTPTVYGPFDDAPNPTHPWVFWQYTSEGLINANNNSTARTDLNVAQGGMEFLKDQLVPAVWMHDSSGPWTTLTNWNSGRAPVAPVRGPGQPAAIGTQTLPTARLPSTNDTVVLDRPNANITVTLTFNTQNIRKLFMRETLNISGGRLNVHYVPSWDSDPISAQFSGSVTLSGTGVLSVHTLQVDSTRTFTLSGGALLFNTINLMPHSSSAAGKIAVSGNLNLNAFSGTNAIITNGVGTGNFGSIDLLGANRTFTVASPGNLYVEVPISNGALTKAGTGTIILPKVSTYSGGTTVSSGRLLVNNNSASGGTGTGAVTVNGGVLGGVGRIAGAVTVNSGGTIMPGTATSIGTLTLNSAPTLGGTTAFKVNRNGGSPLADKIVRPSGSLTYGGTLAVSNIGAALVGGEVFTLFSAGSYTGSFSATQLPALSPGLNWYLGDLTVNGTIRVNRSPIASLLTVTNNPANGLQIPFSSLLAVSSDPDGNPVNLAGIGLVTTNGVAMTTNSTVINYANTVNVADQFNFTISDGRGGTGTGTVRILPSSTGQFRRLPIVNSSSITLHVAGAAGSTYYVDRSTNLPVWLTISTNVVPSNGVFDFVDQFPGLGEQPGAAFYRIRW